MKLSVVQYQPRFLAVQENLLQLEAMLADLDTDLVVLPELACSGYVFANQAEVAKVAESIPEGICYRTFSRLSAKLNCSIVYGFAELGEAGKYYNSSVLCNPDGSFFVYRKIHLFNREKLFFSPGDAAFAVHPAKQGVMVGMMICYDWQFPEAARSLALQGAQIICHPANLVLPWCQQAMKLRSLENRVFSITANRIGCEVNGEHSETFTGRSQILDTRGEVLASLELAEPGIATVEIYLWQALDKRVSERNDAFADRRPEFYRGLL